MAKVIVVRNDTIIEKRENKRLLQTIKGAENRTKQAQRQLIASIEKELIPKLAFVGLDGEVETPQARNQREDIYRRWYSMFGVVIFANYFEDILNLVQPALDITSREAFAFQHWNIQTQTLVDTFVAGVNPSAISNFVSTTPYPLEGSLRRVSRATQIRLETLFSDLNLTTRDPRELRLELDKIFYDTKTGKGMAWNRVNLIINTEMRRASERMKEFMAEELSRIYPITREKEWATRDDDRVRAKHIPMDGQKADFLGFFTYPDGARAKHPTASGVDHHDINCRCRVLYTFNLNEGANPKMLEKAEFNFNEFLKSLPNID